MEELFIVLWYTNYLGIGSDIFLKIVFPKFRLGIVDYIANHHAAFAFDCVDLILTEILKFREVDLGNSLTKCQRG